MTAESSVQLEAARLLKTTKAVLRKGHLGNAKDLDSLAVLSASCVRTLPADRKIVAFVFQTLIEALRDEQNEVLDNLSLTSRWADLHDSLIEAANFICKGGGDVEAIRLSNSLIDAGYAWLGKA